MRSAGSREPGRCRRGEADRGGPGRTGADREKRGRRAPNFAAGAANFKGGRGRAARGRRSCCGAGRERGAGTPGRSGAAAGGPCKRPGACGVGGGGCCGAERAGSGPAGGAVPTRPERGAAEPGAPGGGSEVRGSVRSALSRLGAGSVCSPLSATAEARASPSRPSPSRPTAARPSPPSSARCLPPRSLPLRQRALTHSHTRTLTHSLGLSPPAWPPSAPQTGLLRATARGTLLSLSPRHSGGGRPRPGQSCGTHGDARGTIALSGTGGRTIEGNSGVALAGGGRETCKIRRLEAESRVCKLRVRVPLSPPNACPPPPSLGESFPHGAAGEPPRVGNSTAVLTIEMRPYRTGETEQSAEPLRPTREINEDPEDGYSLAKVILRATVFVKYLDAEREPTCSS